LLDANVREKLVIFYPKNLQRGRETAGRGRQTAEWMVTVGEAFQPVGERQTVNEWGNE